MTTLKGPCAICLHCESAPTTSALRVRPQLGPLLFVFGHPSSPRRIDQ